MQLEVSPFPPGREDAGIRGISVCSSPVAILRASLVNACKSIMLAQWTQEQTVPTNGLQQALTCTPQSLTLMRGWAHAIASWGHLMTLEEVFLPSGARVLRGSHGVCKQLRAFPELL